MIFCELQWFGGWGVGGLLSEWAYQDKAKNTLFTPGAHIDLVLKCAWLCCIKFKISRMSYLVLNILGMGGGEGTFMEAYKYGPFATTPSEYAWTAAQSNLSPPGWALAELYMVALGMRGHVQVLPVSQSWRDFSTHIQSTLAIRRYKSWGRHFVTTQVNYGDRPAGSVAIATMTETAKNIGDRKEKAPGSWRTGYTWMMQWEGLSKKNQPQLSLQT